MHQQAYTYLTKAEEYAPSTLFLEKAKLHWLREDHDQALTTLKRGLDTILPKAATSNEINKLPLETRFVKFINPLPPQNKEVKIMIIFHGWFVLKINSRRNYVKSQKYKGLYFQHNPHKMKRSILLEVSCIRIRKHCMKNLYMSAMVNLIIVPAKIFKCSKEFFKKSQI